MRPAAALHEIEWRWTLLHLLDRHSVGVDNVFAAVLRRALHATLRNAWLVGGSFAYADGVAGAIATMSFITPSVTDIMMCS